MKATLLNKQNSYTVIGFLKFPLSCVVVAIHSFGTPLWSIFAVPTFFLISGYLFYNNYERDDYRNINYFIAKYKKRIHSLFIPYLLWNFFYVIYLSITQKSGILSILEENNWMHIFWDSNSWGAGRRGLFTLSDLTYFPIYGPLWYVRELLICVVFSPIITMYIVKSGKIGILFLAILFITKPLLNIHCFTLCALFFFTFGGYLSIHNYKIYITKNSHGVIFFILSLFTLIFSYIFKNREIVSYLSYNCYIILIIISIFYLSNIATNKNNLKFPKWLSETSFMVYMLHYYYLNLCWWVIGEEEKTKFVRIIAFFTSILLSVATYHLLKFISPKILRIINGR